LALGGLEQAVDSLDEPVGLASLSPGTTMPSKCRRINRAASFIDSAFEPINYRLGILLGPMQILPDVFKHIGHFAYFQLDGGRYDMTHHRLERRCIFGAHILLVLVVPLLGNRICLSAASLGLGC